MKAGSMIETAASILGQHDSPMSFAALWREVKLALDIDEEEGNRRIGHFYTSISLDGRFVALSDNFWDLSSRYKYDQVHHDSSEYYSDAEETDQDPDDIADEKEYNQSVQGSIIYGDEETDEDADEEKGGDASDYIGL